MEQKELQKSHNLNRWLYLATNTPEDFPWLMIVTKPDKTKAGLTVLQVEVQDNTVILSTVELGKITIDFESAWVFEHGKTKKGSTIWTQGL